MCVGAPFKVHVELFFSWHAIARELLGLRECQPAHHEKLVA